MNLPAQSAAVPFGAQSEAITLYSAQNSAQSISNSVAFSSSLDDALAKPEIPLLLQPVTHPPLANTDAALEIQTPTSETIADVLDSMDGVVTAPLSLSKTTPASDVTTPFSLLTGTPAQNLEPESAPESSPLEPQKLDSKSSERNAKKNKTQPALVAGPRAQRNNARPAAEDSIAQSITSLEAPPDLQAAVVPIQNSKPACVPLAVISNPQTAPQVPPTALTRNDPATLPPVTLRRNELRQVNLSQPNPTPAPQPAAKSNALGTNSSDPAYAAKPTRSNFDLDPSSELLQLRSPLTLSQTLPELNEANLHSQVPTGSNRPSKTEPLIAHPIPKVPRAVLTSTPRLSVSAISPANAPETTSITSPSIDVNQRGKEIYPGPENSSIQSAPGRSQRLPNATGAHEFQETENPIAPLHFSSEDKTTKAIRTTASSNKGELNPSRGIQQAHTFTQLDPRIEILSLTRSETQGQTKSLPSQTSAAKPESQIHSENLQPLSRSHDATLVHKIYTATQATMTREPSESVTRSSSEELLKPIEKQLPPITGWKDSMPPGKANVILSSNSRPQPAGSSTLISSALPKWAEEASAPLEEETTFKEYPSNPKPDTNQTGTDNSIETSMSKPAQGAIPLPREERDSAVPRTWVELSQPDSNPETQDRPETLSPQYQPSPTAGLSGSPGTQSLDLASVIARDIVKRKVPGSTSKEPTNPQAGATLENATESKNRATIQTDGDSRIPQLHLRHTDEPLLADPEVRSESNQIESKLAKLDSEPLFKGDSPVRTDTTRAAEFLKHVPVSKPVMLAGSGQSTTRTQVADNEYFTEQEAPSQFTPASSLTSNTSARGIGTALTALQMKRPLSQNEIADSRSKSSDSRDFDSSSSRLTALWDAGRTVSLDSQTDFSPSATHKTVSPHLNALARVLENIQHQVAMLRHTGSDSMTVLLKPDLQTEISLRLDVSDNRIEATACCEKGDYHFLNSHWPELQATLQHQGVQLQNLRETVVAQFPERASTSAGFSEGRSHRQAQPESADSTPRLSANETAKSNSATARNDRRPATNRLLESWA